MTKTALITGASGGIGRDFALKFAREGYNVVIVARSEDKLRALADEIESTYKVSAQVMAYDLTDPAAPGQIYEALAGTPVDVLVNNAGFATYGYFHELDLEGELGMIHLNITALTHLTRLFLPDMVARGSGGILNVASTAAFQPGPLMAVYYASKAFVLHFSEAIANEVKDKGVHVSALCPGPTESGFQQRAGMEDSKLVQNGLMTSEAVVEQGYNGLMRGQTVVIPGVQNKVMAASTRFVPRPMVTRLVRSMQERVGH